MSGAARRGGPQGGGPLFSIVMAVYNVAEYLDDAMDSLLAQTVGFENLQIILVDDASTDGSAALCDAYAARYPDNVLALHQQNQGPGAARNHGLRHARGTYVNFLDPDDRFSANTLQTVQAFFDAHPGAVDMACIPIYYFEGRDGGHTLNHKFSRGSRIIDLREEPDCIHLSCASAFFTRQAARRIRFDTRLVHAEDAKVIIDVLREKPIYGVAAGARYEYRIRTALNASMLQSGPRKKGWYADYLRHFSLEALRAGSRPAPRFVQYTVAYDLQWYALMDDFPPGLLTEAEQADFFALLAEALAGVDDDVLRAQRHIDTARRQFLLRCKHGDAFPFDPAETPVRLDFLTIHGETARLEGLLTDCLPDAPQGVPWVQVDTRRVPTETAPAAPVRALGRIAATRATFRADIPLAWLCGGADIRVGHRRQGEDFPCHAPETGLFFPVATSLPASYWATGGLHFSPMADGLRVRRAGLLRSVGSELRLLRALLPLGREAQKAIPVRLLAHAQRLLPRRRAWLFTDRIVRADDNAEVMMDYALRHARGQRCVFAISPDCPDWARLRGKWGRRRVIPFGKWRYKLLRLGGCIHLSSHADHLHTQPFGDRSRYYADLLQDSPFVFLQHGVTQNDLSGWLSRHEKNITRLVVATRAEQEAFLSPAYGYRPEQVPLTGLPRYDLLRSDTQRVILIAPSWRYGLMGRYQPETGNWGAMKTFRQSDYFRFYNGLLNDPALLATARAHGYALHFLPHPNIACAGVLDAFDRPEGVVFLDAQTSYREAFARAALLVTDYSSVAFDFAYLNKPLLYCQFDRDTFLGGHHILRGGYFDYDRDGFGPVVETLQEAVHCLTDAIKAGCPMPEGYRTRVANTFAFQDQGNRARVLAQTQALQDSLPPL